MILIFLCITSTVAELNILDGVTSGSGAELNIVDGNTSAGTTGVAGSTIN